VIDSREEDVMALTERSRPALYQGLTDLIEGEEAVGEMLSFFPARGVEEQATEAFVAAQIADVRAEIVGLRADLIEQMAAMQRTYIRWTLGALVSLVGVMVAMGFRRSP
jgi:hypothetical protein